MISFSRTLLFLLWLVFPAAGELAFSKPKACKDLQYFITATSEGLREKIPNLDRLVTIFNEGGQSKTYVQKAELFGFLNSNGEVKFLGVAFFKISSTNRLELSFNTEKEYEDLGISRILLMSILDQFPSIKSLQSTFVDNNLGSFIWAAMNQPSNLAEIKKASKRFFSNPTEQRNTTRQFVDYYRQFISLNKNYLNFRQQLINAYFDGTPAGRIRTDTDFKHLDLIKIEISKNEWVDVIALSSKGERKDEETAVLILDTTAPFGTRFRAIDSRGNIHFSSRDPYENIYH